MTYFPLTKTQREWQERAATLAQRELAPRAEETDRTGCYPKESLEALQIKVRHLTIAAVEVQVTGTAEARVAPTSVNAGG